MDFPIYQFSEQIAYILSLRSPYMADSMQISPQAAPVRQQTVIKLRQAIIDGIFSPNERLYEKSLCELIGVSRTSIREALRQLETEGLVRIIPNRGPVVAELTPQEAREIYEVREQLEGLAVKLFARRHDTEMLNALSQTLQNYENILEKYKGDIEYEGKNFVKESNDFYDVLLKGCGNELVFKLLELIHTRLTFLRATSLSEPGRAHKCIKELKDILLAIKRRDEKAAIEASNIHIKNASEVAIKRLERDFDEKEI